MEWGLLHHPYLHFTLLLRIKQQNKQLLYFISTQSYALQVEVTGRGRFKMKQGLQTKAEYISMVTDRGKLLFCCLCFKHIEGVQAALRWHFFCKCQRCNFASQLLHTKQLCILAVTFKIKQNDKLALITFVEFMSCLCGVTV